MAVSESRILPPAFIEAAGKTYLGDLATATGQFKTADLSKVYGPQFVAGMDPLQQQAIKTLTGGIGAYQPYLQAAGAATGPTAYQAYMSPYQQDVIDTTLQEFDIQAQKGLPAIGQAAYQAGAFGGARQGVAEAEYGAQSARNRAALQAQLLQQGFGQAQQLAQQAQAQRMGVAGAQAGLAGQELGIGQAQLAAQLGLSGQQAALAGQRGALGQLRGQLAGQQLGVGQSQLGAQLGLSGQQAALAGQRGTLGQLRGQLASQQLGVGQAQLGAQMGLAGQQLGIGQFQAGLAGQAPGLVGQQISGLTTLGGLGQAQRQAQLAAQQQLAQQQLTQGLTATQALGSGLTSLIAGYPGQSTVTTTPTPSPLQTALSTGATLAGLYKGFGNIFG